MNILQVVSYFAPAFAFGGAVQAVYSVSKELARRGHNVTVFTTNAANQYEKLAVPPLVDFEGIRVHYMRNISQIPIRLSNLFLTPELLSASRLKISEFDVIHLNEFTTFQNAVVSYYALKHNVPYVLQVHGSLPKIGRQGRKWLFDVLVGSRLLRNASKVIALSCIEAEQYVNAGVPFEKVAVIPNGIDLPRNFILPSRGSFKRKFGIPDSKKLLLYLGRIHRTKGLDLLLKSQMQLVRNLNCDKCFLALAGPDDGYLNGVKSLTKSLGVQDSVLFVGFLNSNDKLAALFDAEVLISPSFNGFPMTFLEACAVGTPIITTTMSDKLEWIDDNAGLVTIPEETSLAEAIYSLILDDGTRKRFSENCRKMARSAFSISSVVSRLEAVYEEVGRKV